MTNWNKLKLTHVGFTHIYDVISWLFMHLLGFFPLNVYIRFKYTTMQCFPSLRLRPPKKSLRFLVIGQLRNQCRDFFLGFFANREIRDTCCICHDQISNFQSMAAKRGLTNQASVYTPMWKSHSKQSMAEFRSIQQLWLQLDIIS